MVRGKPLAVLVILLLVVTVFGLYYWIKQQQAEIQRVRQQRAEVIAAIDQRLRTRFPGIEFVQKELDSHCGRLVYSVEFRDRNGKHHKNYYAVPEGTPMGRAWLRDCLKLPAAPNP